MRIISGKYGGRNLYIDRKSPIRPTSDRIKETLFNILEPIKKDALVLDLFAGTGSIGIEFLSRGASFVHFNDIAKNSIDLIRANLELIGEKDRALITRSDAIRKLKKCVREGYKFDYIFIDPPYGIIEVEKILTAIDFCDILNPNGIVITEQSKKEKLPEIPSLELVDERASGVLRFYQEV